MDKSHFHKSAFIVTARILETCKINTNVQQLEIPLSN